MSGIIWIAGSPPETYPNDAQVLWYLEYAYSLPVLFENLSGFWCQTLVVAQQGAELKSRQGSARVGKLHPQLSATLLPNNATPMRVT